jgi:hypothetical protein
MNCKSAIPGVYGQVNGYHQPPVRGAVLGCIPPSRSTCTSTTFAQLNYRVIPRMGTRFAASIGGTNLLPDRAESTDPGAESAGRDVDRYVARRASNADEYGLGPMTPRRAQEDLGTGEPAHV